SVAVPLLLCHEDHVVGNHAASAGRLDEEMLFYLMSRGISRKEAEGLIVESRMIPTLDRIRNDGLRSELLQEIHETIVRSE
ncbi:MAG: SufD family Fe-S cluster assembly protein, partial [Peptoniphilaceae bacterium]|nr:SufD family Fe-S cluster assembly protein [Peptoniphilaceae bacterium]